MLDSFHRLFASLDVMDVVSIEYCFGVFRWKSYRRRLFRSTLTVSLHSETEEVKYDRLGFSLTYFSFFFSKQTTEIDESKFRPSRPEPVRGFFLLSIDCSATNPIKLIRSCLLADCTGCLPSFTELFIVLPQHWFDFRWIFTMLPCSVVFYRVFVGYYRVFIYLARSSLI